METLYFEVTGTDTVSQNVVPVFTGTYIVYVTCHAVNWTVGTPLSQAVKLSVSSGLNTFREELWGYADAGYPGSGATMTKAYLCPGAYNVGVVAQMVNAGMGDTVDLRLSIVAVPV